MKNLMKTLNVPADMPIENKMISRSIETAQKKVEGNNFDIRKHLVEYDDVINKHRQAIYNRRREILEMAEGVIATEPESQAELRNLSTIILDMVADEITAVVNFHTAGDNAAEWNVQEIYETVRTIWTAGEETRNKLQELIKGTQTKDKIREEIIAYLLAESQAKYLGLETKFARR